MHWISRVVVMFAVILIIGNAQCAIACAFEHCGPSAAQSSHCHPKTIPDKGQPASAPCSHDISIVDASVKNLAITMDLAFFGPFNTRVIAESIENCFSAFVETTPSPHGPDLSLISILRI